MPMVPRKRAKGLSKRKLKRWLDLVCRSDVGTLKLINIFLSRKHKIEKPSRTRSFLSECLSLRPKTPNAAFASMLDVCGRDDTYFGLCAAEATSISSDSILSTTMDSMAFHRYILGPPKPRVKSVLPVKPASHTDADERRYREALEKVPLSTGWYQAGGTLGKPFPNPCNVWFTDQSLLQNEIDADGTFAADATKVRDALGLIETNHDAYLLSLQFSASRLHAITDLKMARPGYADFGNSRFAVYLDTTPKSVYRDKWGITVNLRKLAANPPEEIHGVPERICKAIPLSQIGDWINPAPLGWVVGERGKETGIDDDSAFIARLCGGRNITKVKRHVLSSANRP